VVECGFLQELKTKCGHNDSIYDGWTRGKMRCVVAKKVTV
jgi:hypothetical protein